MSGAALRLALLLSLLAAIAGLQMKLADAGTPVTLAGGALLLCAIFAGKLAKGVGLPRLTGYLLIGVAIGPYVLKFIPEQGVSGLDLTKGLAVSLIALAAGLELRLDRVARVGKRVLGLGVVLCSLVFLVAAAVVFALKPLLPFLAGLTLGQTLAVCALVSTVVVSFSPTVTIAIVQETRAAGPFTEFLMAMVILGDLVVMVGFAIATGITRVAFGGTMDLAGLFGGVLWELFGSLGIGLAIGFLTLLYLRKVGREVAVFICALCFVSAEMGSHFHLSPLLLSLSAGALISNLDPHRAEHLEGAVERAGLPVFALFFAASGAGLHLSALKVVGPAAVVLVLVRGITLFLASRRFIPRDDETLRRNLWMGLISQAGVTFGLAALVERTFPAPSFGPAVNVLIVAMVTLHELVGPVLTRRALHRAGEIPTDLEPEKV